MLVLITQLGPTSNILQPDNVDCRVSVPQTAENSEVVVIENIHLFGLFNWIHAEVPGSRVNMQLVVFLLLNMLMSHEFMSDFLPNLDCLFLHMYMSGLAFRQLVLSSVYNGM